MGTGAQSIAAASRVPPCGLAAVTDTGMPGDATTSYTKLFVSSHHFCLQTLTFVIVLRETEMPSRAFTRLLIAALIYSLVH
jgi:hypothetical protein